MADSESTSADLDTGSVWDMLGRGIKGELHPGEVAPVLHTNKLWFAWSFFRRDADVYGLD